MSELNQSRDVAGYGPIPTHWAEKLLDLQTDTPLHQTLGLEAQTRMVDFINFEVDKMSMASSIEARVPFLDHKLWEFCATLPAHYKLKGSTEKYLLRRATQNILPEATRTRRKKGLASPTLNGCGPKDYRGPKQPSPERCNKLVCLTQTRFTICVRLTGRPPNWGRYYGVFEYSVWFDVSSNERMKIRNKKKEVDLRPLSEKPPSLRGLGWLVGHFVADRAFAPLGDSLALGPPTPRYSPHCLILLLSLRLAPLPPG